MGWEWQSKFCGSSRLIADPAGGVSSGDCIPSWMPTSVTTDRRRRSVRTVSLETDVVITFQRPPAWSTALPRNQSL